MDILCEWHLLHGTATLLRCCVRVATLGQWSLLLRHVACVAHLGCCSLLLLGREALPRHWPCRANEWHGSLLLCLVGPVSSARRAVGGCPASCLSHTLRHTTASSAGHALRHPAARQRRHAATGSLGGCRPFPCSSLGGCTRADD